MLSVRSIGVRRETLLVSLSKRASVSIAGPSLSPETESHLSDSRLWVCDIVADNDLDVVLRVSCFWSGCRL